MIRERLTYLPAQSNLAADAVWDDKYNLKVVAENKKFDKVLTENGVNYG